MKPYYEQNNVTIWHGDCREILPTIPRAQLLRGFALALDCMLQTLSKNRRLDSLSDGKVSADELSPAYETLMLFCVAGLEGLKPAGAKPRKPRSA